jgi:hypothetical protein
MSRYVRLTDGPFSGACCLPALPACPACCLPCLDASRTSSEAMALRWLCPCLLPCLLPAACCHVVPLLMPVLAGGFAAWAPGGLGTPTPDSWKANPRQPPQEIFQKNWYPRTKMDLPNIEDSKVISAYCLGCNNYRDVNEMYIGYLPIMTSEQAQLLGVRGSLPRMISSCKECRNGCQ